jgi:hypothetical protein
VNGSERGHDRLLTHVRKLLSTVMTPAGTMRPCVTEAVWREEFLAVADRLAGTTAPVLPANCLLPGKVVSFVKSTREGHREWGQSMVHYKDVAGRLCVAMYYIDTEAQVLAVGTEVLFVLHKSAKERVTARDVSAL